MAKRKRTDSVAGQQEVMEGALNPFIEPPEHLRVTQDIRPFWDVIIKGKAKRAWLDQDLVVAAELAGIHYQMVHLRGEITSNPAVLGDPEHPIHKLLDMVAKRGRMLAAHLQIHPEATQGKSREQTKQNQAHQEATPKAEPNSNGDTGGLIPGTTIQ